MVLELGPDEQGWLVLLGGRIFTVVILALVFLILCSFGGSSSNLFIHGHFCFIVEKKIKMKKRNPIRSG